VGRASNGGAHTVRHAPWKLASLATRRAPGPFQPPSMTDVQGLPLSKSDLDVINPGPGEYVHVMEGQRHGYGNLTIGITYTAPGGVPLMHTHKGEESHVLLKGQKVLYALGYKLFVKEGPYIVNIPPGVPHSFQNLDDEVAELVVIFPSNVWEYDVLDYFPFPTPEAKVMAAGRDERRRNFKARQGLTSGSGARSLTIRLKLTRKSRSFWKQWNFPKSSPPQQHWEAGQLTRRSLAAGVTFGAGHIIGHRWTSFLQP
jgi:mannose-6-phosphate isomerase-like protein (cupin superfamily)